MIIWRNRIKDNRMTRHDLFCMIFLALDADWNETRDEELGKYLSDANPFLFAGEDSAISDIYTEFCSIIKDESIVKEKSFDLAKKYVNHLNNRAVTESFYLLEEDQWKDALNTYLDEKYDDQ